MPDPYREAIVAARQSIYTLDAESVRRIRAALAAYARGIERALREIRYTGREPAEVRRLRAARALIERQTRQLDLLLARIVSENRLAGFNDTLAVWAEAERTIAASRSIPLAKLGALRAPPVTMLGVWEAAGTATTWRTLLDSHVLAGGRDVAEIVTRALTEQVSPDELARRLRRYVVGSEPFEDLFTRVPTLTGDVLKIDLRSIPRSYRNAARTMQFNAKRIAVTEIHQARGEAETQHAIRDPFVKAMHWELSPDRGELAGPDECDILNGTDWYGMGPGNFPVRKVPPKPHPFDRCELIPVERAMSELGQPKPNPELAVDPMQLSHIRTKGRRLTIGNDPSLKRARRQAAEAVNLGAGVLENPKDPIAA